MKLDGVLCPHCGACLSSALPTCYQCKAIVYPWQERLEKLIARWVWRLLLAIVLIPYVLLLLRGVGPLQILQFGFFTLLCGAIAPLFYFFFLSIAVRKIDLAVRWLIPGPPVHWKITLVSVINLVLLATAVGLLGYWWLSHPVDRLTGDTEGFGHFSGNRSHIQLGSGFLHLALPATILLTLIHLVLEVFKIQRRIYPEPGLPEDLLNL